MAGNLNEDQRKFMSLVLIVEAKTRSKKQLTISNNKRDRPHYLKSRS